MENFSNTNNIFFRRNFVKRGEYIDNFFAFFFLKKKLYSVNRRHILYDQLSDNFEYESEIILTEWEFRKDSLKKIFEKKLFRGEDPRLIKIKDEIFILSVSPIEIKNSYLLYIFSEKRLLNLKIYQNEFISYGKNWFPININEKLHLCSSLIQQTLGY